MPDKQRGDVDFSYPNGFFKDTVIIAPIQLYQLYELEVTASKLLKASVDADGFLLIFCMLGEGSVTVGKERYPITLSDALVCPANVPCVLATAEKGAPLRCVCVNLKSDPLRDRSVQRSFYAAFSSFNTVWSIERVRDVHHCMSLLIAELCAPRPSTPMVRSFLDRILVHLYRGHLSLSDVHLLSDASVTAVGHTVYAVIRYIDEHLYFMNNLMEMAQELGYSYNYLSHLFRKKTGMTIQSYVSRKKIERSTALLTQPQYSITEIAAMLNYDCIQSFSKAFKKSMNMSPTEYRAMHGFDA